MHVSVGNRSAVSFRSTRRLRIIAPEKIAQAEAKIDRGDFFVGDKRVLKTVATRVKNSGTSILARTFGPISRNDRGSTIDTAFSKAGHARSASRQLCIRRGVTILKTDAK